jgi:transcriptional regulator with XRE-family HTH domain
MRNQVARKQVSATAARNLRTLLLLNVFAAEEIGTRIAQAREEAGLTQEDLGDLIDLSTRQVQNLEAGVSKPFKHLEAIAGATGKPSEWFLREDEDATERDDRLRQIVQEELADVQGQVRRILALLEAQSRSDQAKP